MIKTEDILKVKVIDEIDEINHDEWRNVGLELLVDLSKKGEIDPWDVDLIYLIDKFLKQIQEDNLQKVGDIIFFVSVLFRLKSEKIYHQSNNLEYQDGVDSPDYFGDLVDFEQLELEEFSQKNTKKIGVDELDRVLIRNPLSVKQSRKRKITLNDLIKIFKTVKKSPPKKRKQKTSLADFSEETDIIMREDEEIDALEIAHEENLEEKIKKLSTYILEILPLKENISLEALQQYMGSLIDTFLSALFLSHDGKVELQQKEFYREIQLYRLK